MICYVGHRLARICIEDAITHAQRRVVFGKKLIESEVIRNKLAHMSREVEAQQAWIESIVYANQNLSHAEANERLGGLTALLKAHISITLELAAREAVQVLAGLRTPAAGSASGSSGSAVMSRESRSPVAARRSCSTMGSGTRSSARSPSVPSCRQPSLPVQTYFNTGKKKYLCTNKRFGG